jgi:hypothetical protein
MEGHPTSGRVGSLRPPWLELFLLVSFPLNASILVEKPPLPIRDDEDPDEVLEMEKTKLARDWSRGGETKEVVAEEMLD